MKRLVISTLSLLALSSFVAPAFAGEISFKKSNRNIIAASTVSQIQAKDITPFNLVTNSYQGLFRNQGIPSGGAFLSQVRTDKIEAEDLVQVAIASNRLNQEALGDGKYLNHVESLLDNLDKN